MSTWRHEHVRIVFRGFCCFVIDQVCKSLFICRFFFNKVTKRIKVPESVLKTPRYRYFTQSLRNLCFFVSCVNLGTTHGLVFALMCCVFDWLAETLVCLSFLHVGSLIHTRCIGAPGLSTVHTILSLLLATVLCAGYRHVTSCYRRRRCLRATVKRLEPRTKWASLEIVFIIIIIIQSVYSKSKTSTNNSNDNTKNTHTQKKKKRYILSKK